MSEDAQDVTTDETAAEAAPVAEETPVEEPVAEAAPEIVADEASSEPVAEEAGLRIEPMVSVPSAASHSPAATAAALPPDEPPGV